MMVSSRHRLLLVVACGTALACTACSNTVATFPNPSTAQVVFDDLNAAILSVSGTASDDVYAVGADPDDGLGPYVLHFNGQGWRRLTTGASGDLWWVSVSPIDGSFYMAGDGGKILRLDPTSGLFEQYTIPDDPTLYGVWGASANDIWTVGGDPTDADLGGVIARFDGDDWTLQDLSELFPTGLPTLYKVWGRGASDIYAVGRAGVTLHYDGTAWATVPNDTERTLFTVHGDESRVFATGGAGQAVIAELHDGSFVNRADPGLVQMNGVYVPANGTAVAVGNQVTIAFQTATGWERQDVGIESDRDLHGVWVDPDGGIWSVGGRLTAALDRGIVIHLGNDTIPGEVIVE